jgi:hypothetical protein
MDLSDSVETSQTRQTTRSGRVVRPSLAAQEAATNKAAADAAKAQRKNKVKKMVIDKVKANPNLDSAQQQAVIQHCTTKIEAIPDENDAGMTGLEDFLEKLQVTAPTSDIEALCNGLTGMAMGGRKRKHHKKKTHKKKNHKKYHTRRR